MSATAGAVSVLSVLSVHGVPMLIRCVGSAALLRLRPARAGRRAGASRGGEMRVGGHRVTHSDIIRTC